MIKLLFPTLGLPITQNFNLYDFYELGFDTYLPISAIHNTGYYELLDEITKDIVEEEEIPDERLKFLLPYPIY